MGIEIYDDRLILINWSKVKLHYALSLRLHLKGVKIAWNVTKVGVHACLLKWVPKSISNFNYEKVKKSAYLQPWFEHP